MFSAPYSHDISSVREDSAKFFFGILQAVCPDSNRLNSFVIQ